MISDTYCVLPWIHLATTSTGDLRVCCNSTPGKNLISRADGTAYRIDSADIADAWHSDTYVKIRQQMIDGIRPDMCQRCFREEDAGIWSSRQGWNSGWFADDKTVKPRIDIKYVDLRLGNLCNVRCRMCNPYASNQWVDEWGLVDTALNVDEYNRLSKMTWFDNTKTWENLAQYADTIEEIYLTGGEPTLALSQYELFDRLIKQGIAKSIRLKYNTNMTSIPQRMLDYWKEFKQIKINASIDAYGNLNRYIRYPTNWKSVDKNLQIFNEMKKSNNLLLRIHCTVQAYNILHLTPLIDYIDSIGELPIYYNILNHPNCLNIRVLPKDLKELAKDRLAPYINRPKISSIIDYMMAEDWQHEWPNLIKYTKALDVSRNEDITAVVPEYVF
jgi:organic radical activating enzyme